MSREYVVAAASARKLIAAVMTTVNQTKALTTSMKELPLRATGLRFGKRQ